MFKGVYGKRGRPPKDWKNPITRTLQIKKGNFRIIFDKDGSGDLKDFMN